MKIPLKERAENFTWEEIELFPYFGSTTTKYKVEDYLSTSLNHPLFLQGPKGSGKTLSVMGALNTKIKDDEDFLPVMFIYKQANTPDILNPTNIASRDDWGKRYEIYENTSTEDLIQESNAIIRDDIHYICEAIVEGREKPEMLIDSLNRVLEHSKKGKKTLLVSEEPLNAYAEKLKIDELTEMLPEFGQIAYWLYQEDLEEYNKYKKATNHISFFEVPIPTIFEWQKLLNIYDIDSDEYVEDFVYQSTHQPRALVKFAKMFSEDEEPIKIYIENMVDKARQILPRKTRGKKLEFYNYLLNFPVLDVVASKNFSNLNRVLNKEIDEDDSSEDVNTASYASTVVEKQICDEENYKIYDKQRFRLIGDISTRDPNRISKTIDNVLEKAIRNREIHENRNIEKIKDLTTKFLSNEKIGISNPYSMFFIGLSPFIELKKRNESLSLDYEHFKRFMNNANKYYIPSLLTGGSILNEPFQLAFGDALYEIPTSEILAFIRNSHFP